MESVVTRATARATISYDRLPGFGPAWRAVVAELPAAEGLYARSPANPEACRKTAEERLAGYPFFPQLADLLAEEGALYGLPDTTVARLSHLRAGRAVVVVTGQQVGYLGGPFFTLVKAYHTVRLARALEATLKFPVLPLFWLEGEDHDLAEIRATHFPTANGTLGALGFTPEHELPNQEVGRYPLGESSLAGLHSLLAEWPDVAGDAAEALEHSYGDGDLSTAMGRLLAATLGERGLFICEGRHNGLKTLAQPLWERVIDRREQLRDTFVARSAEVRAQGFTGPMSPTPDAHFFYVVGDDFVRRAVTLDGVVKHPDGSSERVSPDELKARVARGEWSISPKAGLRPLYQDFVLPSIAYVGGPGELEYHAQLAPFYSLLNVTPPSLFPRLSVTLAEQKCERLREKLGLSWEDVFMHSEHDLIKRLLESADEHHTTGQFAAAKTAIESAFGNLKSLLHDLDPTLEGALGATIGKALHPLEQLEQKANKAIKQRHAVELARLQKLLFAVRPNGKPMERIYGTAWALLHYGIHGLLEILDTLPADGAAHHIVITE
ncbi:MAG: bacillithiol biosynthesis cysteine-adding enzyme BshC [bacterium]|nr:bacillithiol biosynthesis cysteine-adding enzyme BshC [bacterium]